MAANIMTDNKRQGIRRVRYHPAHPCRTANPYIIVSMNGTVIKRPEKLQPPASAASSTPDSAPRDKSPFLFDLIEGPDRPAFKYDPAQLDPGARSDTEQIHLTNGKRDEARLNCVLGCRDAQRHGLGNQILRELDMYPVPQMLESEKETLRMAIKNYQEKHGLEQAAPFSEITKPSL